MYKLISAPLTLTGNLRMRNAVQDFVTQWNNPKISHLHLSEQWSQLLASALAIQKTATFCLFDNVSRPTLCRESVNTILKSLHAIKTQQTDSFSLQDKEFKNLLESYQTYTDAIDSAVDHASQISGKQAVVNITRMTPLTNSEIHKKMKQIYTEIQSLFGQNFVKKACEDPTFEKQLNDLFDMEDMFFSTLIAFLKDRNHNYSDGVEIAGISYFIDKSNGVIDMLKMGKHQTSLHKALTDCAEDSIELTYKFIMNLDTVSALSRSVEFITKQLKSVFGDVDLQVSKPYLTEQFRERIVDIVFSPLTIFVQETKRAFSRLKLEDFAKAARLVSSCDPEYEAVMRKCLAVKIDPEMIGEMSTYFTSFSGFECPILMEISEQYSAALLRLYEQTETTPSVPVKKPKKGLKKPKKGLKKNQNKVSHFRPDANSDSGIDPQVAYVVARRPFLMQGLPKLGGLLEAMDRILETSPDGFSEIDYEGMYNRLIDAGQISTHSSVHSRNVYRLTRLMSVRRENEKATSVIFSYKTILELISKALKNQASGMQIGNRVIIQLNEDVPVKGFKINFLSDGSRSSVDAESQIVTAIFENTQSGLRLLTLFPRFE